MGTQLNPQEWDVRAPDLYQDRLNHCIYHSHTPYPIPQAFQFQFLSGSLILLLCNHEVAEVFGWGDMSATKGYYRIHVTGHITLTESYQVFLW